MSQSFEDLGKRYRENVMPDYFNNPNLTSFDFGQKNISNIPLNPDLVHKITRARFLACGLTQIPEGLDKYTNITMIDLTENYISALETNAFSKFTSLQSLTIADNKLKDFSVNLNPSLITLDLSYNPKLNIDDVWKLDLPNLEVLKLTHCSINKLPDYKPKWISTVRTLHLDGNLLEELPSYMDEFEVIEEISLFGNKFSTIDTALLPQQFKLVNLYFNYIRTWETDEPLATTTLNLNTNLFQSFPMKVLDTVGLRVLMMSHCNISGILDFALPDQLAALDLSFNSIEGFGEEFVKSLSKLSVANFSHNKISSISDSFPASMSISRLILDYNDLIELPNSFTNCIHLDQLSLSNNKLTTLPSIQCPHLRILNLSFNRLKELPESLSKSTLLSDLNIAFNQLSSLPHAMVSCRKVVDLNASGNKFKVFPKALFSFSQLKTLILSSNEISTIPISVQSFFFLQTLDLSNNHLIQIPAFISQFMSLKIFSLSHNLIEEFPYDFSFPPSITCLDLSYNKLTKFTYALPNCLSLNLDCNNISEFNPDLIPLARFISVNNNPFQTPVTTLITSLFSLQSISTFEMLKCYKEIEQIPPMRFHVISDCHVSLSNDFSVGYSATMGVRPSMEDAITFQNYDNKQSLFALFDGHQGNVAAATSAVCLHNEIIQRLKTTDDDDISEMLQDSFVAVNKKLKIMSVRDGCTAVAAFIKNNSCYTVGVGDSRIVRVRMKSEERATTDYKPTMRAEFERLRESGLTVNAEGRIGRKLAVSRSMGDFWCHSDSENQSETGALFVTPQVNEFTFENEEPDQDIGLIIACDGVWDVISDHEAAEIVRKVYNTTRSGQDAATRIRNIAFALGSKDNISCIVVLLNPPSDKSGLVYKNEIEMLPPVVEEVENDEGFNLGPVAPSRAGRRRR